MPSALCSIIVMSVYEIRFLLVICSMYQSMETFTNCIISCRSSLNSTTMGDSLSTLSYEDLKMLQEKYLRGLYLRIIQLRDSFQKLRHHVKVLDIQMKQLKLQGKNIFHYGICLALHLYFLLYHQMMNAVGG